MSVSCVSAPPRVVSAPPRVVSAGTKRAYMKKISDRHRLPPAEWSREGKKNRMNDLLYNASDEIKALFQYDEASIWSFTHLAIAEEICELLLTLPLISRESIVTDAFAGVGGSCIQFAKHFAHVNTVELDPARFKMLCYNLKLFDLSNVTTQQGYYQDMEFQQDVIFFDPPWGITYRDQQTFRSTVSGPFYSVSLEDLLVSNAHKTKYAVLKLPFNYDKAYLTEKTSQYYTIINEKTYPRPNTCTVVVLKSLC